jgi:hypothetical protein
MKKVLHFAGAFALVSLLLLAAGCSGLADEPAVSSNSGTGTLSIQIGSGARTLSPALSDFAKLEVEISGGITKILPLGTAETSVEVALAPGSYSVTAKGYNAEDKLVATSLSTPVTVAKGKTASTTVVLSKPSEEFPGTPGIFEYTVTFPSNELLDYSTARIYLDDNGGHTYTIALLDGELAEEEDGRVTATAHPYGVVESGIYDVTVTLTSRKTLNGTPLGTVIKDKAYIFPSLTTKAVYSFTEDDLNPFVVFKGRAAISDYRDDPANTYVPTKVYLEVADGDPVDADIVAVDADEDGLFDLATGDYYGWELNVQRLDLDGGSSATLWFDAKTDAAPVKTLDYLGYSTSVSIGGRGNDNVTLTADLYRHTLGAQPANAVIALANANTDQARYGYVYFTAEPAANYGIIPSTLRLNGGSITIQQDAAGRYYFSQPASNVELNFTVTAFTFKGTSWASVASDGAYAPKTIELVDSVTGDALGVSATSNNWAISVPTEWKYAETAYPQFKITWESTTVTAANKGPELVTYSAPFDITALPSSISLNAQFYPVTYTSAPTGGTVATVPAKVTGNTTHTYAASGSTVRVTAAPTTGYSFGGLSVEGVGPVPAEDDDTGLVYTFTQPAAAVGYITPSFYALTGSVQMDSDQTYTISLVKVWGTNDWSTTTKVDDVDYGTAALGAGTYSRTFAHPAGLPKAYNGYVYFEVTFSKAGTTNTYTSSVSYAPSGAVGTITIPVPAAPAAPTLNSVTSYESTKVRLSVYDFDGIYGYNVYRVEGGDPRKLNSDAVTDTYYLDEGLTPNNPYMYVVKGLNVYGIESAASAQVTGTTLSPLSAAELSAPSLQYNNGVPYNAYVSGNNTGTDYYRWSRSVDGGPYTVIATQDYYYNTQYDYSVGPDWFAGAQSITYKVEPLRYLSYNGAYVVDGPAGTETLDLPVIQTLGLDNWSGYTSLGSGENKYYRIDTSAYRYNYFQYQLSVYNGSPHVYIYRDRSYYSSSTSSNEIIWNTPTDEIILVVSTDWYGAIEYDLYLQRY